MANDNEYPFLRDVAKWLNGKSRIRSRYGEVAWVEEVKVERSGCAEGTCQWEDIVVIAEMKDGKTKLIRFEGEAIFDFFKSISEVRND